VQCAERLRVQAYFDGEVDALAAADIERHAGHCPECRALLEDLGETRARIRRDLDYEPAPPALRERITQMLDVETAAANREAAVVERAAGAAGATQQPRRVTRPAWGTRPFWLGALGGLGAALAASVAFLLLSPMLMAPAPALLDEVVAAHVRSLMPSHLTDVVSTDHHTVKPWFAGHADVSPVVADFAPQGYRLVGGRADYFDHQRAAVVVYEHGAHVINVFTWVAGGSTFPEYTSRNGYHLAFWRVGDLQYCAVTDAGWDELQGLVRLLRELGARDAR
jgi:anti-sigma factor RsiW